MIWENAERCPGYSTSASRWDIFHPATIIRLWTVHSGNWNGGTFRSFWLLKNAEKFASQQTGLFVDIENEWTHEKRRVRNNPDRVPYVRYERKAALSGVWWGSLGQRSRSNLGFNEEPERKAMRDHFADLWPAYAGGAVVIALFVLWGFAINAEHKQWQLFADEHSCKVTGHMTGDTVTTVAPIVGGNGGVAVGISSTPSKTAYLCDDGVTYWR